ncbi:MAG: hypothetical protein LBG87_03825 [Spirochaetaceae bacterium]|jgi:hypothetical protein|nr:hypothetical protein [Spirochaetaceae bacterium]
MDDIRDKINADLERKSLKQDADKIIQHLKTLHKTKSQRGIWELFQNAVDVSDTVCEVSITQTENSLDFSHNGKPFTIKTLYFLIMQVSSKESQNENEVGQFGTGFLTTHSFGKKILLSGSIINNEHSFINFERFLIDREAENPRQLIGKLQEQHKRSRELLKLSKEEKSAEWTTFSFQTETDKEKENVRQSVRSIPALLPYVMAINEKLQKVTIIDIDGNSTVYEKETPQTEDGITVTSIAVNQEKQNIYSIQNDTIVIILPLSERDTAFRFSDKMPKLFLFYPLIGTESFGFNYIVHSKQFEVTEPRDGIHLEITNDQIKKKVENNREILTKVFNTVTAFVSKRHLAIKNCRYLAIINFATKTDYFKSFKKQWVDAFKNMPLVQKSDDAFITPLTARFFGQELLKSDEYFDAIYRIANIFWAEIPRKEIAKEWRNIVVTWEEAEKREIKFLSIKAILEKIQDVKTLAFFEEKDAVESLQKFYTYALDQKRAGDFDSYALIPNLKNEFRKKTELRAHDDIPDIFVEIADVIMPEVPKRFIRAGFTFDLLPLQNYDKKEYSKDINVKLSAYKVEEKSPLPEAVYQKLLTYCTVFDSPEETGKRRELTALISTYKGVPECIAIPGAADIAWTIPVKCLLRNFIWELYLNLSKPNNGISIQIYYDLLSITNGWEDAKDIITTLPVFPNQEGEICAKDTLKIDGNIPEAMKVLFDEVVAGKDKPSIKAVLLNTDFDQFLTALKADTRKPEEVAREIETKLTKDHPPADINNHPFREQILSIIENIQSDKQWEQYFPLIAKDGKEIFIAAACTDDETKKMMFDIAKNPEKAKQINQLLNDPGKTELIDQMANATPETARLASDILSDPEKAKQINQLLSDPEKASRIQQALELDPETFAKAIKLAQSVDPDKIQKSGTDPDKVNLIEEFAAQEGYTLDELGEILALGKEALDFENNIPVDVPQEMFPEEDIADLSRIDDNMRGVYNRASRVVFKEILQRSRISHNAKEHREHIKSRYRGICQMCETKKSNWKTTEIFLEPEKEIHLMNFSLCPNCAAKYSRFRNDDSIMSDFKRNILDADVLNGELRIDVDSETIRFTAKHLAEIQALLRLQLV